jgi:FPC/CPF motif-containing protein YcgG
VSLNAEIKSDETIRQDIRKLLGEKFYPCVAAVQSRAKNDFVVETCEGFGTGKSRGQIRSAVLNFLEAWKRTRSTTLSLWIAYPNDKTNSEVAFEKAMWDELSSLTSVEERESDWASGWSQNPNDRNFTLCIGGHAFFVVGLHEQSSRKGRRFPYPALIFNVYDQFRDLQAQGAYDPMVAKNRQRDVRFNGDVNPMSETWGDTWETIQFSGRKNSSEWKCPFHFKSKA